jgi:tetratricopeptide (TPR) repeat protein
VELRNAQNALSKDQAALVLATGYEALGKTAEAEENYKLALQAHPTDLTLLRNAANFYRRNGQAAKGIALLQKVLEPATAAPELVVGWARRNLALSLAASGTYQNFKQAQALLEANHKQFGDTEEDKRTSALVLATQPQYRSEAIKQFEVLSARRELPPETTFVLAQLYEADGQWERAKWKLDALARNHENNAVFLTHLATLLLRHKRHDEALPYVLRLSKLKPNQLETVMLYTRVLKGQGNTEKALSVARNFASAGNPPQQAAYLFEDLGDKNQAENYFRAYVAAAPDRPERALLLAGFLGRVSRTDEALDICDKAWDKCAPEAVALTAVGLVRSGKASDGQERQIDSRLQAAIARHPEKRVLLQLRAEFRDYCGRTDEAIALYRELIQAEPRNIAALNNLAVLLALKENQGGEALMRINAAIEIAGPVAQLLDTRAMVYMSERRPDMAIRDLEDALKQEPSPLFYFHQARAYNLNKNRLQAQRCWEKATTEGLTASALPRLERPTFEALSKELAGS